MALAGTAAWPRQIAAGLALLLGSRVSARERHAGLQLAAAMLDLAGPLWLLDAAAPVCADLCLLQGMQGCMGAERSVSSMR